MTNVAMIGLGFGAEFTPIYQACPGANVHAICRRDESELHKVGDQFGIEHRYTSYDDVLTDPDVDYVHINTPIPDHAWMSLAAFDAGKHVMCTVPMATTIDDCRKIVEKVEVPDYAHLLPEQIRHFTLPKEIHDAEHLSFIQGGGHGGSHPHLVNEFLSALREDRDPWPNAVVSANWTCVGICAHESATKGGEIVRLPDFTLTT